MDSELTELRRLAQAAPGDAAARERYLAAAVRVVPDEAAKALRARSVWIAAEELVQDAAAALAARALGAAFELLGVRTFTQLLGACTPCRGLGRVEVHTPGAAWLHYEEDSSSSIEDCAACAGSGGPRREVSGRTAVFRHRATGMELSLVPTIAGAALLGRFVVTREQFAGAAGWLERGGLPQRIGEGGARREEVLAWLGGHGLRLPSWSEWTAGLSGAVPYLDAPTRTDHARPCACTPAHPHPVTRFADHPGSFGLVEMLGNVWEATDGGTPMGGACGDPRTMRYDFETRVPEELLGFRAACGVPGYEPQPMT